MRLILAALILHNYCIDTRYNDVEDICTASDFTEVQNLVSFWCSHVPDQNESTPLLNRTQNETRAKVVEDILRLQLQRPCYGERAKS